MIFPPPHTFYFITVYKILVEENDRLKQFKDSRETRPTVFYLNDYLLVLKVEM